MPKFKEMPMSPDQLMLFGQSVEEALPKDCNVRTFNDMMDCMDYSCYDAKYSDTGCPPYPPKVMVKILAYAYSEGVFSSRKIEQMLKVDVRFIWLAGGLKPDHNTIARFRKSSSDELSILFKESVKLCMCAGLVFLNSVSIDGTKVIASASKKSIYNQERIANEQKRVDEILRKAQESDDSEDDLYGKGNSLPKGVCDKEKLQELAKTLDTMTCKNVVATDTESRVMKTRNNGKCPAYNLQASVDSENQVIVAMDLTAHENDSGHLPAMIEQTQENTGFVPDVSLADSGYCDESSLIWIEKNNKNVLMPLLENPAKLNRNDPFALINFHYDEERDVFICPAGNEVVPRKRYKQSTGTYREYTARGCMECAFREECTGKKSRRIRVSIIEPTRKKMREKLKSPEGKAQYRIRKQTVEPVFGQMKRNRGFTRLLLGGYNGALSETSLMCMIHNIGKCMQNLGARAYLALIKCKIELHISVSRLTAKFVSIVFLIRPQSSLLVCCDREF